jgi:phospholipase/carboxylesterase
MTIWNGLEVHVAGEGAGPVVVLMHGFGAPGDDLVALADHIDAPPGTRFVFPEAPLSLPPQYLGGRAWWPVDIARLERSLATGQPRDVTGEAPPGLDDARAAVTGMLDVMEKELAPTRVFLGGFSQGAMLACDVALRTPRKLDGLIMLSGSFMCESEWRPLMPARKGLRALVTHGRRDPLLPFGAAERLKDALAGAGLEVTWSPFDGAHEIPRSALRALGAFLAALMVLLVCSSARAEEKRTYVVPSHQENAIQADLGLAVVGLAYERVLGRNFAMSVEGHLFGIWWDEPQFRGFGWQVRPTWFVEGTAPRGIYVAPFFRVERVTSEDTGDTPATGWSAGTWAGYSFMIGQRFNLRIGAGIQYMHYVTDDGTRRVAWKTVYPALDLLVGYTF